MRKERVKKSTEEVKEGDKKEGESQDKRQRKEKEEKKINTKKDKVSFSLKHGGWFKYSTEQFNS